MARKINEAVLTGASVKEPAEPTLESRVSGLEYRMSHPNKQTMSDILMDTDNRSRFQREFERCCKDKGEWPQAGYARVAASTSFAEEATEAGKAPIAGAVIWGAVLGAALSLAVLLCFNPAAFHRPMQQQIAAVKAESPKLAERSTGLSDTAPLVVVASAGSAGTIDITAASPIRLPGRRIRDGIVAGDGRVKRGFRLDAECWVSVNDKPLGVLKSGTERYFNHPVTIRSGCPGSIHYTVNGETMATINQSQKPEQSEVVTLP